MLVLSTIQGEPCHTDSTKFLTETLIDGLVGSVDLILTPPPYPLNRKKLYGNEQGMTYKMVKGTEAGKGIN